MLTGLEVVVDSEVMAGSGMEGAWLEVDLVF